MRKSLFLILILLFFYSCSRENNNVSSQNQDENNVSDTSSVLKIEQYSDSCQNELTFIDTAFQNKIIVKITQNCIDTSLIIDTIIDSENRKRIYTNHNTEIVVSFENNKESLKYSITKEKFLTKEYNPMILKKSLFGNVFLDKIDDSDTTIFFSVFFGFPDSDFGEMIEFKAGFKNGIEFLKIAPEIEKEYINRL